MSRNQRYRKMLLLVLLCALFSVLGANQMYQTGYQNRMEREGIKSSDYRRLFFAEKMRADAESLSGPCQDFLKRVEEDARYFPVPESSTDDSLNVSFVDSWMGERNYKGSGVHEGTDIMASENVRGLYPVVSISEGVVTNLGWLEKGGWRVGITSPGGVYFYYAHLESYADIEEGDTVMAGQLLGFMGDSGYGEEGTVGQFDVHLHLGIYSWDSGEEISVNPYYLLQYLEDKKLKYAYS